MARIILCLTLLLSIAWTVMTVDEDGCFISEVNKVVPVGGEVTPIGDCIIIKCEGKGRISALSCPSVASIDPKCNRMVSDLSRSYPYCCPKFICE